MEEIFNLIDEKGNGTIVSKDIGILLRAGGLNPTSADINKIIEELGGLSGCILISFLVLGPEVEVTFEQAVTQFQSMKSKGFTPDKKKLLDVFKIYDRDGNGFISSAEVIQILSGLGLICSLHLTLLR